MDKYSELTFDVSMCFLKCINSLTIRFCKYTIVQKELIRIDFDQCNLKLSEMITMKEETFCFLHRNKKLGNLNYKLYF